MGDGFVAYDRPGRSWGAFPTDDGLTCIAVCWPNRRDVEGTYLRSLELDPAFAERVRAGRREAPFIGGAAPDFFRKPFGPGWALAGDAGYHKDPITAQGITDAFLDAERLSEALDAHLAHGRPFEETMAAYEQARNAASLPMYELTSEFASLSPPPPEMLALLSVLQGNQPAIDDFVSVIAGTVAPADFFAPSNVEAVLGQSHRSPWHPSGASPGVEILAPGATLR
jgi:2-polyprenyl-6-methoxyphenol hydroxylase-like FAD-dependent oxidoreductase